ncbi:Ribonuclease HI [Hartmannibacter diazotrophicus]|uniref:Ribonuclease H n=1 Tax=Hartmannibacter diazotrophicus TaxID=1482074 RepID=A0A2C9D2K2_9HYPH|nr:ribonuclease HI [Hartmannibacter diazotrophicus]SON53705.1 Ribonuclease HI [Hartmannibacter diazotrophicus]
MNDNEMRGVILVHTDGSCAGNPGPGGWAAELEWYDKDENPTGRKITLSGRAERTTSNRMEMTAAIEALKAIPEGSRVEIVSDSQILINGMKEWVQGWIGRGWLKSNNKPVENVDLWKQLVALAELRDVRWFWIKGHDGDEANERVDRLAHEEAQRFATLGQALG